MCLKAASVKGSQVNRKSKQSGEGVPRLAKKASICLTTGHLIVNAKSTVKVISG